MFAGATRDWPAPWVAAFGVLHELGARHTAGLDLANRCAGLIDALWLAKLLVESGTHRTVAVCSADRYDHLLSPRYGALELVNHVVYGAGAATAIVSADAANHIAAYSQIAYSDLSAHAANGPIAGGTRRPVDEAAIADRLHRWHSRLSIGQTRKVAEYSGEADRHNYRRLFAQTGWDGMDFVACSHELGQVTGLAPGIPASQLEVLRELGISEGATALTIPHLGHIGPADLLLSLGAATAVGRKVGPRVAMSMRTPVYSNALAISARGDDLAIRTAGDGIDVTLWATPEQAGPGGSP
ncbi:MAG TPA: hypothetical protein VN253_19370 [Kofleriaceae bacterium]|nr:hypothetical protein [Kofleriaceae bacterium]